MLYIEDHNGIVAIATEEAQTWALNLRKGNLGTPDSFGYKRVLRKVAAGTVVLTSPELLQEHPERFCGDVAMLPQIRRNNNCVQASVITPFVGGALELYEMQLEFGFGSAGKDELFRQMLFGMPDTEPTIVGSGSLVLTVCA